MKPNIDQSLLVMDNYFFLGSLTIIALITLLGCIGISISCFIILVVHHHFKKLRMKKGKVGI